LNSLQGAMENIYEMTEMMMERVGYYDDTAFVNTWNRLLYYDQLCNS